MGSFCLRCVLFLLVTMPAVSSTPDTSVCTPHPRSSSDPTLLQFPDQISASVEMNILSQNKTMYILELYDAVSSRYALEISEGFDKYSVIFDNATQQVYTSLIGEKKCVASDVKSDPHGFLFADANGNFMSFSKSIRFGDKYKVIKRPAVERHRGILVDVYDSCVYIEENGRQSTMNVVYYFANQDAWQTGYGSNITPVRIEVKGTIQDGTDKQEFEHHYEITFFYDNIDGQEDRFLTPPVVACQAKKSLQALPKIGRYFSFAVEEVNTDKAFTSYLREYYDSVAKIVSYDYRASIYDNSPYGDRPMRYVDDFNTGINYIIDKVRKNCTVSTIDPWMITSKSLPGGYTRMRTPEEYFDLDNTEDGWTYQGQRTVRDIQTDVFVATKKNWPIDQPNRISYWQYHFATEPWYDSVGNAYDFGFPVRVEIRSPNEDDPDDTMHMVFNFFEYSEEQPPIEVFDISSCFVNNSRRVWFVLPDIAFASFVSSPVQFKQQVRAAIIENSGLSSLRVAQIEVFKTTAGVCVEAALLDKAPIIGSVAKPVTEVLLSVAFDSIVDAVKTSSLVVNIPTTPPVSFTVLSGDARKPMCGKPPPGGVFNNGYSAGAMAAVGVSMVVAGLILGVLGVLLFNRLRTPTSDSFLPKRFDNSGGDSSIS